MYARIEGIPQKNWMVRVSTAKECIIGMTKYYYNLCWKYEDEYKEEDILQDMNKLMEILLSNHKCDVIRVKDMKHGALLYALSQHQISIIHKDWITWYERPISCTIPLNDIGGFLFPNKQEFLKYRWQDWTSLHVNSDEEDEHCELLEKAYADMKRGFCKSEIGDAIREYVDFHPTAFYLFNTYSN